MHSLYNMVDAFWLGKLSKEALSAPGVSMPLMFVVVAFGMGFGNGGTALVSQHTGAGQHGAARRAAGQTLVLLVVFATVLVVPVIVWTPQFLRFVRVPPEVVRESAGYLRILMFGAPLFAFSIAYTAVLRALGDTFTMVIVGVACNVLNLVLDPILIFGLGPVPALGTPGAAAATVMSRATSVAICVLLIRRGQGGLRLGLPDLKPDRTEIRRIVAVGMPAGIGMSSSSLGFAVFQVMINSLGVTVIGAFTVGFRILRLFSIPAQSMAAAAGPVVGQALGAGKPDRARRVVGLSLALVAGGMFLPYALVMWQGKVVARAFTSDASVLVEARRFFLLVPASTYCFDVLMTLTAAFYGSGHTRPVMVVSLLRQWVFRLPVAYLFGIVLGFGSLGVYSGLVAGNLVCAVIILWLFIGRGWESAVIDRTGEAGASAD